MTEKKIENVGEEIRAADATTSEGAPAPGPTHTDTAAPADALKTVEAWAKEKKTDPMIFAMAKSLAGWPIGRELDSAKYDEGIAAAKSIQIGGSTRETIAQAEARRVAELAEAAKTKTTESAAPSDAKKEG